MANLRISVQNKAGEELCRAEGQQIVWLAHKGEYQPGDTLVFTTDEFPACYFIQVDGGMDEAYVYLTGGRVEYPIPFEPEAAAYDRLRLSYCPGSFAGESHYIAMRKARREENANYRNLALNPMDRQGAVDCWPHVTANAETKGPIAPVFAVRNVIDGVLANAEHWPWPFQAWGIDQREDAAVTLEFGRPVNLEELWLVTRADFPHDSWWKEATVVFSDGSSEVLPMQKSAAPHIFPIRRQGIAWLRIERLVRADDPSPFPALTQIMAWGRSAE